MRQSGRDRTDVGSFAQTMIFCINELVENRGAGSLLDPYPGGHYVCDNYGATLEMRDDGPSWLTYKRIINIMDALVLCGNEELDEEVFDGPFEAWIPRDRPTSRVVTGQWFRDGATKNRNTVNVPVVAK